MNTQIGLLIAGIAIALLYIAGWVISFIFKKVHASMSNQDELISQMDLRYKREIQKLQEMAKLQERKITELQQRLNHASKKI